MLMSVFSVYDSCANVFMTPIYVRNKGEMLRLFIDWSNNPETVMGKHPEDYSLFEIATWDDSSSGHDLLKVPVKVVTAIECLKKK